MHDAALGVLQRIDQFAELGAGGHGNVRVRQQLQPGCSAARGEPAFHIGIHGIDVLRAVRHAAKARIAVPEFAVAHQAHERLPVAVGVDDGADPAVDRPVGPAVGRQQARVAGQRGIVGREGGGAQVVAEHEGGHGLVHRHLDVLAFLGPALLQQCGEHRLHHVQAHRLVGDIERQVARASVRRAGHQTRQSDHALDQVVVGRLARVGAVLGEAGQEDVDQPRVVAAQGVPVQSQFGERLLAHVGDEHVAGLRGTRDHLARGGLLEVQADAALAAVEVQVDRPHARLEVRAHLAHDVALGRLELDHVGAVLRQHLGRERTHDDAGEVEDPDAGQRQSGVARRGGRHWASMPAFLTMSPHLRISLDT